VRAVLFDVFGTVVDWRSGIAAAVRPFADGHGLELDPHAFADTWRGQYQPAMQRVRSGARSFVTLDVLHRENLDDALLASGLDPGAFDPGELDVLARAWHFLPPWPDSVAGIAAIKQAGYIVGPMSNGNTSLLLDMAKAAGLPWDLILGSAALLALEPGEVMLAAAHEADLAAARAAGLATAFIARPLEHGPAGANGGSSTTDWDLAGATITEIAGLLRQGRH
jgi:2-haloacid dehalogenase